MRIIRISVAGYQLNHVVKRLCLSVCCVRGKRSEIMPSIDLAIRVVGFTCLVRVFYNQGIYWNIQSFLHNYVLILWIGIITESYIAICQHV